MSDIYFGFAPFTGAWIETFEEIGWVRAIIRTLYGCVNWNLVSFIYFIGVYFAPFTGAWIETCMTRRFSSTSTFAPFTGAWIETLPIVCAETCGFSHPLRVRELKPDDAEKKEIEVFRTLYGCVNWNCGSIAIFKNSLPSHPLRVRELKRSLCVELVPWNQFRTLYGCVNWNCWQCRYYDKCWFRTLYGCVNWNILFKQINYTFTFAPFTGAWIETRPLDK